MLITKIWMVQKAKTQPLNPDICGQTTLYWYGNQNGEKLKFKIPGEMNGRNTIILTTKQSPDGGKFSVSLYKKSVQKEAADLQTEFHTISRNLS